MTDYKPGDRVRVTGIADSEHALRLRYEADNLEAEARHKLLEAEYKRGLADRLSDARI